nr:hypothetical protein FFPRI1PSEUD_11110 [Pseudomonas sp. FFPRI_1]
MRRTGGRLRWQASSYEVRYERCRSRLAGEAFGWSVDVAAVAALFDQALHLLGTEEVVEHLVHS